MPINSQFFPAQNFSLQLTKSQRFLDDFFSDCNDVLLSKVLADAGQLEDYFVAGQSFSLILMMSFLAYLRMLGSLRM